MRNLKKVISLLVALTMAFGLMISAAAFSDDSDIVNKDAAQLLTELKIISGFPDGSFQPAGLVTRAQMAKMTYVAMRKGVDDGGANFVNSNVPLSDIANHWAKGYIKYAYGAGLIAGFPNGTFLPDANVTGYQAAKMLLTALGYDATAEQYSGTGWDFRVAVDAASAGLLEDLEGVDLAKPLSRDNAAQMIYNAIFANMVKYNEGVLEETGSTFAETKLGLLEITGLLIANDQASIDGAVPDEDQFVLMADSEFIDEPDDADAEDFFLTIDGDADISLLGQNVTAFVKIAAGANSEALINRDISKTYGKVTPTLDENNVFVDYAGDFDPDDDYTIADNAIISFNYNPAVEYDEEDIAEDDDHLVYTYDDDPLTTFDFSKGDKAIFIDNDDDSEFDVIIIVNQVYGTATVKSAAETIKVSNLITSATDIEDVLGADAIENDDKVIGYEILSAGAPYEYVVAVAPSFEGTLTGTKGGDQVKVSGTYYEFSDIAGAVVGFDDIATSDYFGETITFYTDGKYIVDADTDAVEAPDAYCGIRGADWSTGGGLFDDDAQVAVTLEDGTEAVYTVDSVGDDIADADHDITDVGDFDEDTDVDANGIADDIDYFVGSVFSYSIDDDKIVLEEKVADLADLAAPDSDYDAGNSTLRADAPYIVNSTTVFFDFDGDDDFTVYVGKAASPNLTRADATVAVYSDDTSGSTDVATVVLSTGADGGAAGNFAMVVDYDVEYNSDDGYYATIKAFNPDEGEVVTYKGAEDAGLNNLHNAEFAKGDIITFTINGDEIEDIEALDVFENYALDPDEDPDDVEDDTIFFAGYALDYEEGSYITLRPGNTEADVDANDAIFELDDDCVVVDLADLDGSADLDSVDPTTDEDDIAEADEGDYNVVVQYDGDVVTAIYYLSDKTLNHDVV